MGISKLNPSAGGIPFGNTAGRPTAATGKLYSNGETARLELYTSAGAWENIVQEVPGVSSIGGQYLETNNSNTITVYGTNFVSGASAYAIGTNAVEVAATSTTFVSLVQLSAVFTGLTAANEPYDIKVVNPSNLFGILPDCLFVNNQLTWTTSAGSLGSFGDAVAISVSAIAADESAITYAVASGSSLPSGITLNTATGLISGTLPDVASNTTYTFTLTASDGSNPAVSRQFSFTSNAAPVWTTSAGSLGSFVEQSAIDITVAAIDPSDTVTYALNSGSSLPSGITLNTSTGAISGILPDVASNTTYTFTINASDGVNTIPRAFSITSNIFVAISTAETLVVAGGGGGGSNGNTTGGGGGGAGGYIYNASTSFTPGTSYTLTIGTGGTGLTRTGGHSTPTTGNKGTNSVISGSGFSTITANGGGGGVSNQSGGTSSNANGGSGGGGNYTIPGGTGVSGQGNAGGGSENIGGSNNSFGGGGGGGSAAAGSTPASGFGGNGGAGTANSITGTSLVYAAGGGAGVRSGYTAGSGGSGIGGTGAVGTGNGGNASPANRGSGGGGGGGDNDQPTYIGGTGSDGVIIIAYPNSVVTPTISGGLTYDQPTRAGYRVYRFTAGSGTVTW